jgi:hypothetical protein
MGWTYTYKAQGMKVREFLRGEFEQDFIAGEKSGFKVLYDTATFQEYFAIMEITNKEAGDKQLFCLVCLTHHNPRSDENFGWKDMTESMGPNAIPPQNFFKKLEQFIPEPDGEYGKQWRERCKAIYAKKAMQKLKAQSFKKGQKINLYGNIYKLTEKLGRSGWYATNQLGLQYRIKCHQLGNAELVQE